MMNILTNVNFNSNTSKNFVLENNESLPTNGKLGQLSMSGTNMYYHDGTEWKLLGTASAPTQINYTLEAASWVDSKYNITNEAFGEDSVILLDLQSTTTLEQYTACGIAKIICSAQSSGSIELTALGTVPTVDIPIVIVVQ